MSSCKNTQFFHILKDVRHLIRTKQTIDFVHQTVKVSANNGSTTKKIRKQVINNKGKIDTKIENIPHALHRLHSYFLYEAS